MLNSKQPAGVGQPLPLLLYVLSLMFISVRVAGAVLSQNADTGSMKSLGRSPKGDRTIHQEVCDGGDPSCRPRVKVFDQGKEVSSWEACDQMESVDWITEDSYGVLCHINPSLEEYFEVDAGTGKETLDLYGYDFTRSPDGSNVAHAGGIVHFAPPYAQSSYLQIGHLTIYPLANGQPPMEQHFPDDSGILDAVRRISPEPGSKLWTFAGIHDFVPGLYWAGDSRRVALIDCVYDWSTENPAELSAVDGKDSERRCAVVVASMSGANAQFPISDVSYRDLQNARLEWEGPNQITLVAGESKRVFKLR